MLRKATVFSLNHGSPTRFRDQTCGDDAVPFFWTQQHDLLLNYVGHATKWDRVGIDGSLAAKDCTVTYGRSCRKLAVLMIGRDCDSLAAEIELEKTIVAGKLTARPSL